MNRLNFPTSIFVISALLLLPSAVLKADDDKPADRPNGLVICEACHGEDGQGRDPQWPNLGGQNAAYMAIQLEKFRDGSRANDIMAPLAKALSDEDINQLAAWYGAQRPMSASADAALAGRGAHLAGYCVTCHGLNGLTVNPDWPDLAGQQATYLAARLRAFQADEGLNPTMAPIIAGFSKDDIEAVAAYYSQLDAR